MIKKNNMSYYLPKIESCGFNIPETLIIQLNKEQSNWLESNHYLPKDIQNFSNFINSKINESNFKNYDKIFMKTGNFSDKFHFNKSCCVINRENIGQQFLNMFYYGMLVGCESSHEIVIRKFIETDYYRKTIYDGMKLNTEFRVFYDFTHNELLGVFNYWDTKTMQGNLQEEDLINFNNSYKLLEDDFNKHKEELIKIVNEKAQKSELELTWSLDFLWDGEKFWLIDMALAKNSYYYGLVYEKDKNKGVDDQPIIRTPEEQTEYDKMMKELHEREREMFKNLFNKNNKNKIDEKK